MTLRVPPPRPYSWRREFHDLDPDLSLYRSRTINFLRRYFHMSLEVGRVPSLLGREVFRARVTSYRMGTFEDAVIFVHDIERCLERLDPESQSLIARIVFQEYSHEEAAAICGCTLRTLTRRFPEAIDRMTQILLDTGLLQRIGTEQSRGRVAGSDDTTCDFCHDLEAQAEEPYPLPAADSASHAFLQV